jgi:hypothetical protein
VDSRERAARAVSPELALVDPQLAAELRAALPEHPWPAVPRIEVGQPAPTRRAHRSPFIGSFVATAFIVAAVTVLTVLPRPDRPTFAATGTEAASGPEQQPRPATRSKAPKSKQKLTARPGLRRALPLAVTAETKSPPLRARSTPSRAKPRTTPQRRRPAPGRVRRGPSLGTRAPSFAWPPHAGARSYDAVFYRNGKVIYHARTPVPRIRVPARIRFTAGVYRWIVRPVYVAGLRTELGTTIVDATFRITGD